MREYRIHHIDSFTNQPFGGNPTVTVLGADSLLLTEMRQIAKEMNLSETGFVLKSDSSDFRLRFFTRSGDEVKFCGHATLGALCSIAQDGLYGCLPGKITKFRVETNAGVLEMEVDLTNPNNPQYIFDAPKIDLVPAPYSLVEIAQGLDIPEYIFDAAVPMMLERTNNYLYLPVVDLDAISKIAPDPVKMTQFAEKDQIVVFCAIANGAFDKNNHLHVRGFAPLVGITEDPFTGSMQGGVAAFAIQEGWVAKDTTWIHVEQGHLVGRPGFARLQVVNRNPIEVKLYAEAFHLFGSDLRIP